MNPDDRLGEAVKQGRIAADAIEPATAPTGRWSLLLLFERAQRRLKRHRLERERRQEVTVDAE